MVFRKSGNGGRFGNDGFGFDAALPSTMAVVTLVTAHWRTECAKIDERDH